MEASDGMTMRRPVGAAAALVVYAATVAWLTWPLAAHLGTHLPDTNGMCRYDALCVGWVLAWESHALSTAPWQLNDTNIYHPAHGTLFYGDTGFGALPYFLPTYLFTGNTTLALNLLLLGGVALTAWTLHLVVRRWTGSDLAGFCAGWTLLGTRWMLWDFMPIAPSEAVLLYIPVIMLLAAAPLASWPATLRLLPVVVLQCLTNVVYVPPAVLGPLAVLALARIVRPATRPAGIRLLVVLVLATLVLLPVYAEHFLIWRDNPSIGAQTEWGAAGLLTRLPWGPFTSGPTAVPFATLALIGIGLCALAFSPRLGGPAASRRSWAQAALWAGVGIYLSLSPTASWYGRPINLPHAAIAHWVPIYRILRIPARLGIGGLFGLAALAGLGFAECARWLPGRRPRLAIMGRVALLLPIAITILAGWGPAPYPLRPAIAPDDTIVPILAQPGGPLLEVPVAGRPATSSGPAMSGTDILSPEFHARAMYRSTFHWRPLVNGYNSYWPSGFPERMALAQRLPDSTALRQLRDETGLELILVHLADYALLENQRCVLFAPPGTNREACAAPLVAERRSWIELAGDGASQDLRLVARSGDDLLFAVRGRE